MTFKRYFLGQNLVKLISLEILLYFFKNLNEQKI